MSMSVDEFDFTTAEGSEVAKEANKGGDFAREIEFLTLKADPVSIGQGKHQTIIRLVTEYERKPWMTANTPYSLPVITVKQHYSPTKQRPPYVKEDGRWPDKWSAVCRLDKVFAAKYGACHLCSIGQKATDRTWALAVEREQVIENGKVVGIRDKMREVFDRDEKGEPIVESTDSDGKKHYKMKQAPAWLVLNFGWKNFFGPLNGQASYYQTMMDRDFFVTRSGMGNNDTMYSFVGLDPIYLTGEWATALGVPDGTKYDMGAVVGEIDGRPVPLSEVLYPDMPDLRRIVAERTTDDYYGRWFVPGWLPEGFDPNAQGNSGGSAPAQGVQQGYQPMGQAAAPKPPSEPVTPTPTAPAGEAPAAGASMSALDALKARVQGGTPAGTPQ